MFTTLTSNFTATQPKPCYAFLHPISRFLSISLVSIFVFAVLLVSFGFASTHDCPFLPATTSEGLLTCGDSANSARALGCKFDLMSFCWLPPACYDAQLSDNFTYAYPTASKPVHWEWYEDATGKQSVPESSVRLGEYMDLFVTWEYHLVHCVFMFRKLHRAVELGLKIDSYIGSLEHTDHCGRMLLENRTRDPASISTIIKRKFPTCSDQPRRGVPDQ